MLVETGMIAWKILALETKIDPFFFAARSNSARGEKLALLVSASLAFGLGQIAQEELEIRIFREHRFPEHVDEPLRIDAEIS